MEATGIFGARGAISLACLALVSCAAQREATEQRDAAEYHDQQHASAVCASQGLLPGTPDFKACLAQLLTPTSAP